MTITFNCYHKGGRPARWKGQMRVIHLGETCEAEIQARGSAFHLIAGKHAYGNYLCIPDWSIGLELPSLTDDFWNRRHLQEYTHLRTTDIYTIVSALNMLADLKDTDSEPLDPAEFQ